MTSFSRRSRAELAPNRTAAALERARAEGTKLLDLTQTNPLAVGISPSPIVKEALARAAAELRYEPEPFGLASARAAVVELWRGRGVEVGSGSVVMTASTSEAYAYALKLLCDGGDEILVPSPSYPLFEHLARLENVTLVPYRLGHDGSWFIDVAAVEKLLTPRTKAVFVVSPNSPTGSYLKREELAGLARLGLPIVSDEVFSEYPLFDDARRARSALESRDSLVIALDGLSKAAALPQLKLAWMTLGGPRDLVTEAMNRLELIADTFLSPGTPVQVALPELLRTRNVAADALRRRTVTNLEHLRRTLEGSPISVLFTEGGWSAVLRLPETQTDEEWTLGLLELGVVVQPGYFFDFDDGAYVVVSLIVPEPIFAEGMSRVVEHTKRG